MDRGHYDEPRTQYSKELENAILKVAELLGKKAYSSCPMCNYPPPNNNSYEPILVNCRDCGHKYYAK